jgi:uncharacterized membrane protein YkvA (DUF1232 family)
MGVSKQKCLKKPMDTAHSWFIPNNKSSIVIAAPRPHLAKGACMHKGGFFMKRVALLGAMLWKMRGHGKLAWAMLRDPRTPKRSKLLVLAAAAYVISPIDLVPDVFAGLGWLDDAAVVLGLLTLAYKLLPADIYAALRAKTGVATGPGAKMDDKDPRVVDMP